MTLKDRGPKNDVYHREWALLERCKQAAESDALDPEDLAREFAVLIRAHESLLSKSVKITKVSDAVHRKLKLVKDQIADKNRELEQRNQELIATQKRLILREKLAAAGVLMTGVAHEILNPLNFVHNFAYLLHRQTQETRERLAGDDAKNAPDVWQELEDDLGAFEENAALICEHSERINRIVQKMSEMVRQDPTADCMETDLNALFERYIEFIVKERPHDQLYSRLSVVKDLDRSLGAIQAAPQDIGCLLLNLLRNGLEAIALKSIKASRKLEGRLKASTRRVEGGVEIRVRDNGVGVPAEDMEKLFTPFFTTKPPDWDNLGMGLYMCFNIVSEGYRGAIHLESEPGEYTEAVVFLPD